MAKWLFALIEHPDENLVSKGVLEACVYAETPENAAQFSEAFGVDVLPFIGAVLERVRNPCRTGGLRLLLARGRPYNLPRREALEAAWDEVSSFQQSRLLKILVTDGGYIPSKDQANTAMQHAFYCTTMGYKAAGEPIFSAAEAIAEAAGMTRGDLSDDATEKIKMYFSRTMSFPRDRSRDSNQEELDAHFAFVARFGLAEGFFTSEEIDEMRLDYSKMCAWASPNEYDVILWRYLVFVAKLWR